MRTKNKSIRSKPKKLSCTSTSSLIYEKDFSKWAKNQARLLKKGDFEKLDIEHLIEEIRDLGRREKQMLMSYLENLLMHKLKVDFQPEKHTKPWDNSIELASHKAQKILMENPSLKLKLKEVLEESYFSARLLAASETNLNKETFPKECPWTLKEIFPHLEKKYL
jgi:hypothetical protein